jgi:hypothetical protein
MSEEEKDPKGGFEKKPSETDQSEKVEISKSELEKLQKKSNDFDGLVLADRERKRKGRNLPGSEIQSDKSNKENDNSDDSQEFVTKEDFKKHEKVQVQKTAITELQKNPEIDEHWEEIMEYYNPRPGESDTIEGIVSAGSRALKAWKTDHPNAPAKQDNEGDKKVISDIASDKGLNEGKDKKPVQQRKSLLRNDQTPMQEWYGKKK